MSPPEEEGKPQPLGTALAVGAGSGSVVAGMAMQLPDGPAKTWLIILSPAIGSIVSAVWAWMTRRLRERERDSRTRRRVEKIRRAAEVVLADPNCNPKRRAQIMKALEVAEKHEIDRHLRILRDAVERDPDE